ncbi:class I SAM-dependent methyltransferase [Candidatus Bathyarchaeota archaeon]|nr:class I SAM-dependent methyltransferase [Candidatus Bathyarchaeota archaeon]MBS7630091.1 class I SAM-dependent methyltransferase [Candidatus Bathyarchaeota archaeon]
MRSLGEGSLILDLGCGTGIYTLALSLFTDGLVCGLDPALGMLKQALEKSKNVLWACSVAESMPIRSNVFHCIFASQVWHHI